MTQQEAIKTIQNAAEDYYMGYITAQDLEALAAKLKKKNKRSADFVEYYFNLTIKNGPFTEEERKEAETQRLADLYRM